MTALISTGAWVPERVVSNAEAVAETGGPSEWITRKTGVVERRWADAGTTTADAAVAAGRQAIERAGIQPEQLGLVVLATSTPDRSQPPTATAVQAALGATGAAALDVNGVCTGFLFALATARGMLATGDAGRYALVIGADIYSRILDRTDHRTVVLFGDGAGAAVIGPARDSGRGSILATQLRSHGHLGHLIHREHGDAFRMDGGGVRDFVVSEVPLAVKGFLADQGVDGRQVRHLVAHQANGVMLDALVPSLELAEDVTVHRTIDRYGNTASASVPITLDHALRQDAIADGELVLLLAFGGGMATGAALMRR
ncbi:3-oxoacyl-ACP synthase III family protein [Streptomyces chryseus]|uniref:3-oxoacyl-ACP synthase III family protein n=1 Tax=Streptomyces chryseus TaxID=68186 RepID=UPI00110F9E6D|nr:ketoacyl-ACP synthase III [Streptomyces chryseus]GGX39503.1 3-oxoacyl-[acyl-carrier-protein] synthase 3 [Streptomyces chryseus]